MIPYNHPNQELLVNFLKGATWKWELLLHGWYPISSLTQDHTIFKFMGANSDFILVRKESMGRPPIASRVFERGLVSYVHPLIIDDQASLLTLEKYSPNSEWKYH
jgi:hypothetical protein